jgi:hypothetical protein
LKGRLTTFAPRERATSLVLSSEPSSTTTISIPGWQRRISSITSPTESCSLKAGTIASRCRSGATAGALRSTTGAVLFRSLTAAQYGEAI